MDKNKALFVLGSLKPSLFKKYPIARLGIFGSVSRGEQGPDSDLDVLVEFHQSVGIEFISLAEELEEILNCKVDLVSRKGLKYRYFQEIENDLIYV